MMPGMHLRDLLRALGWSYATLWSTPTLMSDLVWVDGSFEGNPLKKYVSQFWNVETLYSTSYKSCSFEPGSGYAGKVLAEGQPLWLKGTDVLVRHSNSSSQAHFFTVAGIQTMLCIPWFNSVVELGSSTLLSQNQNLLNQIRAFLLHMPTTTAQTNRKQQQPTNAFSPIEGPLLSQGLSVGSDDASFDGGVNHEQQVDSSSSFPLESSLADVSRSGSYRAPAARHELNEQILAGSGESDRRLSEMLQERLNSPSSPTSSPQQPRRRPRQQPPQQDGEDLVSSFPILHRPQSSLLSQLQDNETNSSSHSSSKGNSHSYPAGGLSDGKEQHEHNSQWNPTANESNKSLAVPGFTPWNASFQRTSPGRVLQNSSKLSNQVVLQRSIKMTYSIPHLNATRENQRAAEQQAAAAVRSSAAAAAAMEAAEVLCGHDEAAVNHMLAERKRRQKQKENFSALRALIPFVSKMDRASILGDAISYVKQLTARVEELEAHNRQLEAQIPLSQRKRSRSCTIRSL